MADQSISELLQTKVRLAANKKRPLNIVAGNSKHFLGRQTSGDELQVNQHRGIIEYDPRELVITARAGTPLKEIEKVLADAGQMLPFEPPHFSESTTLGGAIASGLSGPRRPYAGSARDFVLGCKILNGKGEIVHFGGQVMKNVAGYDVSRLMAGAYGTLGVILEISLKVLPLPTKSITLVHECSMQEGIDYMSSLLTQPLPVDGACYYKGQCYLRVSGGEQSVNDALKKLKGEELNPRSQFWQRLRDHGLSFFDSPTPLWRLAVKPATLAIDIEGEWLLDWGGAQRWLVSNESCDHIRTLAQQQGGHATLFRGGDRSSDIFQPLSAPMLALQQRLKTSFDPHGIFNPGRMYATI